MTRPDSTAPALEARGLVKRFPGVTALDGVDLVCRAGRVHALLGENGAGKSTLVRILTGNHPPDAGELRIGGAPVRLHDPRDALAQGVTAVYQELTVLPELSVLDNVMLGQEVSRRGLLDRDRQRDTVRAALRRAGLGDLDPRTRAGTLSAATRQLVEIARALVRGSRVLLLDEPSALLSGGGLDALHAVVRELAADGVAIIYITHRLEEVRALADDVTVLRDGRLVSTGPAVEYPVDRIVREMVGRDVDAVFPAPSEPGDGEVLSVRGLLPAGPGAAGPGLDLSVRAGEIVGVAGLLGSGRSRLLRTLAGVQPRAAGTMSVGGTPVRASLHAAMRAGVVLVPEERKTEGLVLDLPVRANTTLSSIAAVSPGGWLSSAREREAFEAERERFGIRVSGPEQPTGQLSGGNQQKIVLAKWLRTRPRVLLLDEPTRGIDIGAKAEIYRIVAGLAAEGLAVVFASSELPEVTGLAHRVLVCRGGRVAGELTGDEISEERIMHLALGTQEVAS
ncbi:sugar ABC transporter ATP-binding protein [Actinomadura madurae]|uniref:sugar ABC transporter ATP-binding protein n=2 Tax=Actinomadura madurae TaxID=1993 RepID=UPI002025DA0A|nr:sugar ABC transporter ATP-binding protein [Actinomadura madurae]MCP9949744.1 sugar ABC transporter ATP-binding protein [Actinomadura madurae]MCP9966493.1 sugar ABC transporter ATP-binding protein [Actinomadura madurae]MCQ0009492.1 sugar ABC transporter ATP-binding protein [Actinomadura madurae]MCQ0015166.1 sugar ABC transporter ATP-binding protein [Actinomadura madurae]URM95325.1 sugar ABC transporter ATP-binding protein [Actinomadura madurae]